MKKICVFCGSSTGNNNLYSKYAESLGKLLAENSIDLVYGGGDIGLMGIISRTVLKHGGHVTGIIPELLHSKVPHVELSELIIVKNMHERKALMYSLSDGFICLPGGIGSLEEVLEAFTWLQLGYHTKPVCLINAEGYYTHLIKQFGMMVNEGFMKKTHFESLIIKDDLNGVIEDMQSLPVKTEDKWSR
jgi:uncharacterized protein (TIGR00730 family)